MKAGAGDHQSLNTRSPGSWKRQEGLSPGTPGGAQPCDTWVSDFWFLELVGGGWEIDSCCLKPPLSGEWLQQPKDIPTR